jgi:hypothetical protein
MEGEKEQDEIEKGGAGHDNNHEQQPWRRFAGRVERDLERDKSIIYGGLDRGLPLEERKRARRAVE